MNEPHETDGHSIVAIQMLTAHWLQGYCPADNGTTLWSTNIGSSIKMSEMQPACRDLGPEVGILSTPVVDPTTNTIFLMPLILENGQPSYR